MDISGRSFPAGVSLSGWNFRFTTVYGLRITNHIVVVEGTVVFGKGCRHGSLLISLSRWCIFIGMGFLIHDCLIMFCITNHIVVD